MADYKALAKQVKEERRFLMNECQEVGKAMYGLHMAAVKDGALEKKTKELIALGIAISKQCEGCIVAHVESLLAIGATLEEIAEVVDVAVLMGGGPAVTYGGKAIEIAKQLSA